ncbi:hypothetical protein APSETT445_002429 [Aspergillus pseudonomiae]
MSMGLLAWLVMQCIGEFLAIWPVAGALVEFVGTFVDEDLGTTVGIAYCISLSIAAFSFIGVDIAAATALEARPDNKRISAEDPLNEELKQPWPFISVRFSATWTSFIAWIAYFVAGFVMTLNIPWDSDELPQAGWLGHPGPKTDRPSDSGFVISAKRSGIKGLADLFNVILLFTALTCANTNLMKPLCFFALWFVIKTYRSGGWRNIRWELEDLSNIIEVKEKIRKLDELKDRATARDGAQQKPGWGNLWGVI